MNNFSTGLLTGALLGAGLAVAVCPPGKKEMRRMCCRANKIARHAGRILKAM